MAPPAADQNLDSRLRAVEARATAALELVALETATEEELIHSLRFVLKPLCPQRRVGPWRSYWIVGGRPRRDAVPAHLAPRLLELVKGLLPRTALKEDEEIDDLCDSLCIVAGSSRR